MVYKALPGTVRAVPERNRPIDVAFRPYDRSSTQCRRLTTQIPSPETSRRPGHALRSPRQGWMAPCFARSKREPRRPSGRSPMVRPCGGTKLALSCSTCRGRKKCRNLSPPRSAGPGVRTGFGSSVGGFASEGAPWSRPCCSAGPGLKTQARAWSRSRRPALRRSRRMDGRCRPTCRTSAPEFPRRRPRLPCRDPQAPMFRTGRARRLPSRRSLPGPRATPRRSHIL